MPADRWHKLPPELREMIFNNIFQSLDQTSSRQQHVLSKYASVCLSWKHHFERLTFERLQLSQSCLPYFRTLVRGGKQYRLEYIKVLWLRIRLDGYDCSACRTAEDEGTIKRNCIIFTNAVWDLLEILSVNEGSPDASRRHRGLELDISIHSPSDGEHVFRPLCLKDDCPFTNWFSKSNEKIALELQDAEATDADAHDPYHGFYHGVHRPPPGNPSGRDRLLGTKRLDFDFSHRWARSGPGSSSRESTHLPKACIVRCLTIRRTGFRGFSAGALFKMLHESFTHIAQLRFEKWLEVYQDQRDQFDQGKSTHFYRLLRQRGLPKTLRSLFLLQEWTEPLHYDVGWTSYERALGLQVARSTRNLEHLAITWSTDAQSFFHKYLPCVWDASSPTSAASQPWTNLRTLSLTCSAFLNDSSQKQNQRDTIIAACTAARLMPRLCQLEIWTAAGSAALFAVQMPGDECEKGEVLWMSTWNAFTPNDEVFRCWRGLVRERDALGRQPDVQALTFSMPEKCQLSRWALLDRLVLKEHMLHPASARQAEWERDTLRALG